METQNTASPSFYNERFHSIQVLRGIAALLVVLEHIRYLNCGAFGVDIFFCISGFMIMFTTEKGTDFFLRKRLLRILPLYYMMTLGTYLLLLLLPGMFESTSADPGFLIKSLLFIPFDIGGGALQPLLRIGWTINCEMFFYLLFAISFHISHRLRGLICTILLGLLVLAARLLPVSFVPLTFFGDPVMLEFAFGMCLFPIVRKLYSIRNGLPEDGTSSLHQTHSFSRSIKKVEWMRVLSLGSIPVALLLFAGLIFSKPYINVLGMRRLLYWGLPAMLLVLCFFLMEMHLRMPSPLVRLGDISFSIYLIHYYPVMLLDRAVFDFSAFSLKALIGTLICLPLCILLGYVCWYVFEKQLTKYLRRLFLPAPTGNSRSAGQ